MKYNIQFDHTKEINNKYAKELLTILPKDWILDNKHFEYLFIIGGDGGFLKYAQCCLMNPKIKIVFINSGRLGFYSYVKSLKDFDLKIILDTKNFVSLDLIEISHNEKVIYAINDFSYYSNYTSQIDIYINDVLLQTIHGNGVLATTPMGSTARNKSLGGAILLPNTNVFSLIEIEAVNNRYYSSFGNPIVFNNSSRLCIKTTNYKKAVALYDGREYEIDEKHSIFKIKHATSKAKFLIFTDDQNWINKLNYAFK